MKPSDHPTNQTRDCPRDYRTMVTDLIDSGMGEEGRLRFILECIDKSKPLFNTDMMFLESMSGLLELKIQRLQNTSKITDTPQKDNSRTLISDESLDKHLDKITLRENTKTTKIHHIIPTMIPEEKKSLFRRIFSK